VSVAAKPERASGYTPASLAMARAACLELGTRLGDLLDDLVVVGGLVPSLLIDQDVLHDGDDRHVGTLDVDVGLALGLLQKPRYEELHARLRAGGFGPDRNDQGRPTAQRWRAGVSGPAVDFLIAPPSANAEPGSLQHLEPDLAAIVTPGLDLAFRDASFVELSGPTLSGGVATRRIRACGAGAFLVLKALAFSSRGENKDAYDLYYLLRHFGGSVKDVADCVRPLLDSEHARRAIEILRRDFGHGDALGPTRVAVFSGGAPDANLQADVAGLVHALMNQLGVG
jgi:hypothetical protein